MMSNFPVSNYFHPLKDYISTVHWRSTCARTFTISNGLHVFA